MNNSCNTNTIVNYISLKSPHSPKRSRLFYILYNTHTSDPFGRPLVALFFGPISSYLTGSINNLTARVHIIKSIPLPPSPFISIANDRMIILSIHTDLLPKLQESLNQLCCHIYLSAFVTPLLPPPFIYS